MGILPYHETLGWIDPVTGSMRYETRVLLIPVSTSVETSAIERWLVRREGHRKQHWRFLYHTSSAILYRSHGCAVAPQIYPLHAGQSDEEFVLNSSDEEIAEFVRVMRSGTSTEKGQLVERAINKFSNR